MGTSRLDQFDHPVWKIFGGTAIGYIVILVVFTILLFAVPTLLYSM